MTCCACILRWCRSNHHIRVHFFHMTSSIARWTHSSYLNIQDFAPVTAFGRSQVVSWFLFEPPVKNLFLPVFDVSCYVGTSLYPSGRSQTCCSWVKDVAAICTHESGLSSSEGSRLALEGFSSFLGIHRLGLIFGNFVSCLLSAVVRARFCNRRMQS